MKAVRKRLTYANVMSSIAVFLVLGGATAFAASQLGKNSVGSKQLKKNAVTTAKIKKNAVSGAKIKPGSVQGSDIALGSLGTVPSATNAANLSGFQRKSIRVEATPAGSYEAGLAAAPEVTLFTAGPLTIYAKCFVYSNSTYGGLYIKTSQGGVLFDSYSDYAEGHPYLEPGTLESNRELYFLSSGSNYSYYYGDSYYVPVSAIAADGTAIRGDLQFGVKQGSPADGNGPFGPGNVCLFAGYLTQLNS